MKIDQFFVKFLICCLQPPVFPAATPFYMSYSPTAPMISAQPNPYLNGNLVHQQDHLQLLQNVPVAVETVHLYVPNTVIGAIIGAKGLFIKSIIKNSNASVKVKFCENIRLQEEKKNLVFAFEI